MIQSIISDKFHFIEAKENFTYTQKRGKEKRDQDSIKVTIVTEENQQEKFIKVKVNGTLNIISDYKLYDCVDFENLTSSFG